MVKVSELGMQIFGPLMVIGLCVCEYHATGYMLHHPEAVWV